MRPCLRSGYCCKVAPCGFGKWDESKTQCAYLGGEKPGEYFCEKFDEIVGQRGADLSPASVQDVAHRSMATELLSSNSAETTVTVLLLILEGFVKGTLSPDAMALAIGRAVDRLKKLDMDSKESQDIVLRFAAWAETHRRQNPFSSLF